MHTAYLSLGSNIEPDHNLLGAVGALRERFGPLQVSPTYRTPAEVYAEGSRCREG